MSGASRTRPLGRLRVAIGPFEVAGCSAALAAGLRALGADAEVVLTFAHPFGYPADRVLGRAARVRHSLGVPIRYDVLNYQFGTTWLPAGADARLARILRRTVVMSFHGDDCRLYGLAGGLFAIPHRPGADDSLVRRRLRRLARICHGAIVKDLELAAYVYPFFERVYVAPSPVLEAPRPEPTRQMRSRHVVLHAPSDPRHKGTTVIEAAVGAVADRIPLELRLVSGVSHDQVVRELQGADVVVDQMDAVATGVFALEAMQIGVPVLAEYDPRVLAPFQRDVPIVRVTSATLERELESLLADDERRRELGQRGRDYVARTHAPAKVAAATLAVYAHVRRGEPGLYEATADGIRRLELPDAEDGGLRGETRSGVPAVVAE
jgi:hypothetical protein